MIDANVVSPYHLKRDMEGKHQAIQVMSNHAERETEKYGKGKGEETYTQNVATRPDTQ